MFGLRSRQNAFKLRVILSICSFRFCTKIDKIRKEKTTRTHIKSIQFTECICVWRFMAWRVDFEKEILLCRLRTRNKLAVCCYMCSHRLKRASEIHTALYTKLKSWEPRETFAWTVFYVCWWLWWLLSLSVIARAHSLIHLTHRISSLVWARWALKWFQCAQNEWLHVINLNISFLFSLFVSFFFVSHSISFLHTRIWNTSRLHFSYPANAVYIQCHVICVIFYSLSYLAL